MTHQQQYSFTAFKDILWERKSAVTQLKGVSSALLSGVCVCVWALLETDRVVDGNNILWVERVWQTADRLVWRFLLCSPLFKYNYTWLFCYPVSALSSSHPVILLFATYPNVVFISLTWFRFLRGAGLRFPPLWPWTGPLGGLRRGWDTRCSRGTVYLES